MEFRPYDPERDLDAIDRIYGEIGWRSGTELSRKAAAMHQDFGRTLVSEVNGAVECFASNQDGGLRYLDTELSLCVVAGVGTGRPARRLGLARRLTAEAIAVDVIEKGHAVAVLGIFDQGFYDQIGFGTGPYDFLVGFDPVDLVVPAPERVPLRLTPEDHERAHRGRHASVRTHGSIVLDHVTNTHSEMLVEDGFGLGFADETSGELTHHLWLRTKEPGAGPYNVLWMAYRNQAEFRELMGTLRGLGDQVRLVTIVEPPGIQLQDLLRRPFRRRLLSQGSKFESFTRAVGWWQVRVCDIEACMRAVTLPLAESVSFNLVLSDPIEQHLTPETAARWAGVAGTYVVTLGSESRAESRDPDPALDTLRTSVGTFSRLWLGASASGLHMTAPDLDAPAGLIRRLDRAWCVPRPTLGWDI